MGRQTREERRAEEKRIIAEMDEAMGIKANPQKGVEAENQVGKYATKEQTIHCKRCKTTMENGICPVCGYRVYTPMDEQKRKKIRIIVGAVCVVVFLAAFLILRFL